MKRNKPIPRRVRLSPGPGPSRGKRVKAVNPARRAKASAHAYGPKARRDWMTGLPCCWCGKAATEEYPSHQAHTGKKPGKGIKSHYTTCVPMDAECHRRYDDRLPPFDQEGTRQGIEMLAAHYEHAWLEYAANQQGIAA